MHQNFIPHYRRRLFETLCAAQDVEVTIASDVEADIGGIVPVNPRNTSLKWIYCRTINIGKRLFVHPGILCALRRTAPNIVIAMGNPNVVTTWFLLLWGRVSRVPVVLWTHGLLGRETGFKAFARRLFYRNASALLLYGDHAKALLIEAGLEATRMFVIYNSLDSERQLACMSHITCSEVKTFRSHLGIGDDERVIVFSGRLQSNKKLELLLESVRILQLRGRKVHVALVGDGQERQRLMDHAMRMGIDSLVHCLGETYDESVIAIVFMASDLAVVPSGAGLSVMHALGYGVPVLLHDKPDNHFPEWEAVQEGRTGYFYRYGDVNDMADKMEKALFPISQKSAMKEACLEVIRDRYNANAHAAAIIAAVKQVARVVQ